MFLVLKLFNFAKLSYFAKKLQKRVKKRLFILTIKGKIMKRLNLLSLCFVLLMCCIKTVFAQVTITSITDKDIKKIIEENFLGKGVKIDTTRPIYYNNQTIVNNNQRGIFENEDTSSTGKNIPIKKGLILATTACKNIAGGTESRQNAIHGAQSNSPSLYLSYKSYCNNPDLNKYGNSISSDQGTFKDVSVLDFWVIPQACNMSFKYCFGSEEYPGYVCTGFNDFFGLYCDGPYDDDLNPYTEEGNFYSNPTNIAIIPETYEEDYFKEGMPVMINTCNAGGASCPSGFTGANSKYFIDNRSKTCKTTSLGGYTTRLETAVLQTVPYKKYHIQIAICNINDENLQSAVFLEANSFSSDAITIEHSRTLTDNNEGYEVSMGEDGKLKYTYMKGCASDTMIVKANYIAGEDQEPYNFYVKQTDGSSIVRGVDYDYFMIKDGIVENTPATSTVTIPSGESEVRYLLTFMHNSNKKAGTYDTLLFISTDCAGNSEDTITYIMREPLDFQVDVQGGVTLCHDVLPATDTIDIIIRGAVSFADIICVRDNKTLLEDRCSDAVLTSDTTFLVRLPITIMHVNDVSPVDIDITDFCGRSYSTRVEYNVITSETMASVSKDYICEGDTITLYCPESFSYLWTSFPEDTSLSSGKQKMQNPQVWPVRNTTYTVKSISQEGCISTDSIRVNVEKIVKAEMDIKPKKVYYSDPQIQYTDLSDNSFAREWYFGDGNTSSLPFGYHNYQTDTSEDEHVYEVILVVYNKAMCPDTIKDSVVVSADFTIWMPNAFIPGSDNPELAYFGPKGSRLKDYQLQIFNRWGTKIYEGDSRWWNGRLDDGTIAPQGTYVYYLTYKDGKNMPQRKSGTFALLPDEKR